jgi:hypothetical protein
MNFDFLFRLYSYLENCLYCPTTQHFFSLRERAAQTRRHAPAPQPTNLTSTHFTPAPELRAPTTPTTHNTHTTHTITRATTINCNHVAHLARPTQTKRGQLRRTGTMFRSTLATTARVGVIRLHRTSTGSAALLRSHRSGITCSSSTRWFSSRTGTMIDLVTDDPPLVAQSTPASASVASKVLADSLPSTDSTADTASQDASESTDPDTPSIGQQFVVVRRKKDRSRKVRKALKEETVRKESERENWVEHFDLMDPTDLAERKVLYSRYSAAFLKRLSKPQLMHVDTKNPDQPLRRLYKYEARVDGESVAVGVAKAKSLAEGMSRLPVLVLIVTSSDACNTHWD